MYTMHRSEEFWKQVVIEIPVNIHNTSQPVLASDPVQYLIDYSANFPEKLARRQKLLRSRAFELSYSATGYIEGSSWPLDHRGHPLQDAFAITINHVLGMHSGRLSRAKRINVKESWTQDAFRMISFALLLEGKLSPNATEP